VRETRAAVSERLWCGHGTIERASHDVHDVTLGEDHNHVQTGQAPQMRAALRNRPLVWLRRAGWATIA